jgi:O-antigen/teichoic acid export membrane protein
MLYLTALIFMIAPLGQQFQVLLQKELKFNKLAKIEIVAAMISSAAAIGSALEGFGVYSLIIGQLSATLAKVILLWSVGWHQWHPSFHFAKRDLKGYVRFGLYQMGERTINYFSANIDYIIIGRFLGPADLGVYTLAYQVAIFPLVKVNPVLTKVMFPIMSKMQHDNERLKNGYTKLVSYIAMLSFPIMVGMFIVAPEFIVLFLGEKWKASIIILQIFCVVGLFKSLSNPIGAVLLAKGRADIGFYWNIFVTITVSLGVIWGVNWGINGVAFAILILQFPLFFIIQPIVNRLIAMKMTQYLSIITIPLVCSTAMLIGDSILKRLLYHLETPWVFIATVITGIIIYLSIYYFKDRKMLIEVFAIIKGY